MKRRQNTRGHIDSKRDTGSAVETRRELVRIQELVNLVRPRTCSDEIDDSACRPQRSAEPPEMGVESPKTRTNW